MDSIRFIAAVFLFPLALQATYSWVFSKRDDAARNILAVVCAVLAGIDLAYLAGWFN